MADYSPMLIALATLVTAICSGVAAVVAAFRANDAKKTAGLALAAADGVLAEVKRQNVELKKAVADPSIVAEQETGAQGASSVGIAAGVVTVEPLARDQASRDRKTDSSTG